MASKLCSCEPNLVRKIAYYGGYLVSISAINLSLSSMAESETEVPAMKKVIEIEVQLYELKKIYLEFFF